MNEEGAGGTFSSTQSFVYLYQSIFCSAPFFLFCLLDVQQHHTLVHHVCPLLSNAEAAQLIKCADLGPSCWGGSEVPARMWAYWQVDLS